MKTNKFFILSSIAVALIILSSFSFFAPAQDARKSTKIADDLAPFSEIAIAVPGKLYIKQSDNYSFSATTSIGTADMITARSEDGVLYIELNKFAKKLKDIEMHVELPELKGLTVEGANEIFSEGTLNGSECEFEIDGSATLVLDLDYQDINIEINGSGTFELAGQTEKLSVEINGAGSIKSYDLKTSETSVEINGVGSCKLFAAESLEVEVNGTGSVSYKGNPKNTSFSKNGIAAIKSED